MYRFFFWIPYSLKNSLTKFENFYQSDQSVENWLIRFDEFQLKFIIQAGSNSKHPILFWSYLPHLNSESHAPFFFFWTSYSSRNIFSNFKFFSQSAQPVGNRFIQIIGLACMEH